ncbi:SLC26A/SulP transporter family protein [Rhizobium sp. KVB221]|uniref:SLC26A/SulP transporter family protein n=1 Tax=Rhizobium setariae TaxID=2801340 RepID=A0A936YRY0_9HYPH|nr:SulP family inorganic anion transporter [Rhizobium setariae]MBL0374598.1 SLC26A/SulP transporter family protein [Rhizobium setariae]
MEDSIGDIAPALDARPFARAQATSLMRQLPRLIPLSVVIGLDGIGFAIALATLLFAGELSQGLGMAVTGALGCTILLSFLVGWRSQLKINMACAQDVGAAILAASLVGAVSTVSPDSKLATAFAIVATATLATGIIIFATGFFRAGRLVRFFPLEVLAGFMAATGCLLLMGGIAMVCHVEPSLHGVLSVKPSQMLNMMPAVLLAGLIYLAMAHLRKPFVVLANLVGAAFLFHGWLWMAGMTTADAAALGLLPSVPASQSLQLPFPDLLPLVDWPAVVAAAPVIGTAALLSLFAAMMNISALELATGKELDVNRELRLTGAVNALVSGMGAPPGYPDLATTQLLNKSGVTARGAGFLVALVGLLGLVFAPQVVSLVPFFLSAGLVLYYGFDLVHDWLVATRKTFSLREWSVVVAIVAISLFYSFLVAILAGFLIATVLFAYSYSHAPVIRNVTSLARLPSTTERAPGEMTKLANQGKAVHVIQLQGFLFFGTSEQVVDKVRHAVAADAAMPLRSVIIDFSRATDLDSASANAFKRIQNLAEASGFALTFCALNPKITEALLRSGLDMGLGGRIPVYDNLDLALEKAEEDILQSVGHGMNGKSLAGHFAKSPEHERQLDQLFAAMAREVYAPGDIIIKAGAEAKDIFFLETGRAVIFRSAQDTSRKRLRTMTAGAVLGELAYSLGMLRTADVEAETEVVLLRMSSEQAERLARENQPLAILFNQLVSRALAEKVLIANRMTEHVT